MIRKMNLEANTEVFTDQLENELLQVSKKRGKNRTDLIKSISIQVGRYINKQQYELTLLKNKLIMCDSDVVAKLLAEKEKLETEAAYNKKWMERYKKHHARHEAEIVELKKQLGIEDIPWFEQHLNDPVET